MTKGPTSKQTPTQGTPTYVVLSILLGLVIFGLDSLARGSKGSPWDSPAPLIHLNFIAVGLALCFSWRRLSESYFKKLCALVFAFSFWLYLIAAKSLPLFIQGEALIQLLPVLYQCGYVGIIFSGLCLVIAFVYQQKLAPALMLTSAVGLALGLASIFPLFLPKGSLPKHELASKKHAQPSSSHIAEEAAETEEITDIPAPKSHSHAPHASDASESETEISSKHSAKQAKTIKMAAHASPDHDPAHHQPIQPAADLHHENHADEKPHELSEHHNAKSAESAMVQRLTQAQKDRLSKHPGAKGKGHATGKSSLKLHAHAGAPHWEYSGEMGPQSWGRLSESFKVCDLGTEQSPIDIPGGWPTRDHIQLFYKPSNFEVVDNGHTIQVNLEPGNSALIGGQRYELKQFHFHTPSEHLFNSRNTVMELHFVHANAKGQLAVIGAMIEAGGLQEEMQKIWNIMPYRANEPIKPLKISLNPRLLLPLDLRSYHYQGSLTTPPCSEQVNWNVLVNTLKISQPQIDSFHAKYRLNARPPQPLNYRNQTLPR